MALIFDAVAGFRQATAYAETDGGASNFTRAIRARDAAVRAFVHLADTPMQNLAARSRPEALLAGVPIAVKDLIDVAGMPTRMGSRGISRMAAENAEVVDSLLAEGAVIVGKSHTTEFAMSGWGATPLGRPLNPIDANDVYFTGGSSTGSASAVAAGLVAGALGTDTGGSVRIPSSWCGITGLKGSPGWVSTHGVGALSQSFDVVGPMARTVNDVLLLYRAMLPGARRHAFESELDTAAAGPLPLLVFLDDASLVGASADVLAAYRESRIQCERMGFSTQIHPIPCSFAEMAGLWADISATEGYLNNKASADDPAADIEPAARANLLRGKAFDLAEYFELLNRARACRERMEHLLVPGRLLVVPTTATTATRLTDFDPQRTLGIFTRFVNLIQGSSIAVPNGIDPEGRPTSMQFVGSYGADATIVRAASRWQQGTDWHERMRRLHDAQMRELAGRPS